MALGLAAWGLVVRMSEGEPGPPAAAPPPPAARPAASALLLGPPPWVRYPTPLEGRWVGPSPSGRVTLVVHNAYVDLWQGVGQRQGYPLSRRVMVVVRNRVHFWPPGDASEVATYRWRITGDRLTFDLVGQAPEASSQLDGLTLRLDR